MDFNKCIKEIEAKLGYTFKDKSLMKQAFTRTSFCNENREKKYQSNEVLEFFGDSVLSAAIVTLLMRDFTKRYENGISTKLTEGDFSNIKSKLSDKKNLSASIKKTGLQNYFLMGDGDRKMNIQEEPSVMEDLFESIVGAVYIDSGNSIDAVTRVLARILNVKNYLTEKAPPIQSFKNELQNYCQDPKRKLPLPIYETEAEEGPDHKKVYVRICRINGRIIGRGTGKNKIAADSAAAENALATLMAEENKSKPKITKQANQVTPVQKLRELAAKNKKPSPEYRDLGEVTEKGRKRFKVDCRFSGVGATGCADNKSDAKMKAAEGVLKILGGK